MDWTHSAQQEVYGLDTFSSIGSQRLALVKTAMNFIELLNG
jgi:hypothetical protein